MVAHYENLVDTMANVYQDYEKVSLRASTMDTLIKEYTRSNTVVENNKWIDTIDFLSIEKIIYEYTSISDAVELLGSLIEQYNIKIPDIPDIDFSIIDKYKKMNTTIENFEEMLTNYENSVKLITKYEKELHDKEVELKELMKNRCPLCGQLIKEEQHDKIS